MTKGRWFVISGVILVFLLLILLAPIRQVPYTTIEQYPVVEKYYEKECREVPVEETYYVLEPFEEVLTCSYEVIEVASDWYAFKAGFHAWVVIENTDFWPAVPFRVDFNLNLLGAGWAKRSATAYITEGDSKKLEVEYLGRYLESFTYKVIPPTRTITGHKEVPHTRIVMITECEDVLKERVVYKSCLVTRYRGMSLIGITY